MPIPFPCPACGNKGAFEIIGKDVFSVMDGAICARCNHVVTQEEVNDWFFTVAAKRIRKVLKKGKTDF